MLALDDRKVGFLFLHFSDGVLAVLYVHYYLCGAQSSADQPNTARTALLPLYRVVNS